jgi:hypothetical protein
MATPLNPNNVWFGIPTDISSKFTTQQQAVDYWANLGSSSSPSTPAPVAPVVQQPTVQPPAGASYIDDPAKLSGYTESQIWRDPNSAKIYALPQATLYKDGQKKVVVVGSPDANNLLSTGWSLNQQPDTSKIGGGTLSPTTPIDIGTGTGAGSTSSADAFVGGMGETVKTTEDLIKYYQGLLAPQGESDLSKQVSQLLGEAQTAAAGLTGQGAAQLAAEEAQGIQAKTQNITDKNTLLKTKLAEIDALTKSYELANQSEEGRPQTLSRLQGAQAQNYKLFLAQKNALASEAGIIQAEILGLQGELEASQKAANRAVDLAYADKEAFYNSKINLLNILQPQLEKEEAKYAQALELALNQQATALAEQKQNKKDIQGVKLQAISAGITDANVLNQISSATSYDQALQILGTNMPKEVVKTTSGDGGGGYDYPVSTPGAPVATKTFEQFIDEKENQLGMSIANPEKYRAEYESSQIVPTAKAKTANISNYSFVVQQVIKGNMSINDALTGGTAGERKQYQNELADAESKGLLTTSNEERLYSGLDSQTASAVKSKVSAFKSEPIVTNYNVINEGWNVVNSIPSDTKNPADDQQF